MEDCDVGILNVITRDVGSDGGSSNGVVGVDREEVSRDRSTLPVGIGASRVRDKTYTSEKCPT